MMAYVEFASGETATATTRPVENKAPERLSPVERQVLLMAIRDPISSLRTPGRMARLVSILFGVEGPNSLADPRLEALRRFAVLARIGRESSLELVSAGYSASAIEEARRIAAPRAVANERWGVYVGLLTVLVIAIALFAWTYSQLQDLYASVVVALVAVLPLAAPLSRLSQGGVLSAHRDR